MCQLTLADFSDVRLNALYLSTQMMINSHEHNDGAGFWTNGEIFRQVTPPYLNLNLGRNMLGVFKRSKNPVLGHVRKASYTYGKKSVCVENSHPFSGKRFILAHNGTLEAEDKKLIDGYPDMIDSAIFHAILEEISVAKPKASVVELLQETYSKFTGKFAFLLTDKADGTIYVVRGETATLFKFKGMLKNFNSSEDIREVTIINTEKPKLLEGVVSFANYLQVVYGFDLKYEDTLVTEIPKNKIYKYVQGDLVECGEMKEKEKKSFFPAQPQTTTYSYTGYQGYQHGGTSSYQSDFVKIGEAIKSFCCTWNVSIPYVDEIVFCHFEKRIAEMDRDELLKIPKYLSVIESTLRINKKKLQESWREILKNSGMDEEYPHFYGLPFPYMLSEKTEIAEYIARMTSIRDTA